VDESYEENGGLGRLLMALGPLIVIVAIVLLWRSRQQTVEDRAFAPIVNAISDADIPDRAKDVLLKAVDDVRGAVKSIREMATELADRG
jgi:hypothetical protein